jgi:thioesterase domain-containing protein
LAAVPVIKKQLGIIGQKVRYPFEERMKELLTRVLADTDVTIYLYGDEIGYSGPSSQLTPAVLEFLRENKSDLRKFLLQQPLAYYRNSGASETTSSLARFRHGQQGNMFCIHPATGTPRCFKGMAAEITGPFAVYGVYAMGYGSSWITHKSIQEMSAHYYNQIRCVQPEGPYLLCGYSLGGIIALEIATMMQNAGQSVDPVIIIDSRRRDGRSGSFFPRGRLSDNISELPPYVWEFFLQMYIGDDFAKLISSGRHLEQLDIDRRFSFISDEAHKAKLLDPSWDSIYLRRVFEFQATILRSISVYDSVKYEGDVVYFFAQDEENHSYVRDFLALVTGAVRIVPADGRHISMVMNKENVAKLGQSINRAIATSQAMRAEK